MNDPARLLDAGSTELERQLLSAAGAEAPGADGAARSSLAAGNPREALRALDGFQQRFARGVLGSEATLLRIESPAAAGDRRGAETLARRFLVAQPNSPHAKRLQSLLGPQCRR
jgi:hypothetical protein